MLRCDGSRFTVVAAHVVCLAALLRASPCGAVGPTEDRQRQLGIITAHSREWSRRPGWLAQDAGNLGERAFRLDDSTAGDSRAKQLVKFARTVLFPANDVANDDLPACRQPRRWRLLQRLTLGEGIELPSHATCTALAQFMDPATVVDLEVLFVAPTSARAAASFGHLLLRLRHSEKTDGVPSQDDTVYEISALTGYQHSVLDYLARGLGGGFPLVFDPRPLSATLADNLAREQRSIQRFRLNLTSLQRSRVLEFLWQVERDLVLPYRFLNRNCATYLLWLIATALDGAPPIDPNIAAWAAPADVLDQLARVQMPHDGRPLLQHVAGGFESSGDRATRARDAADAAQKMLASLVPALAERWRLAGGLSVPQLTALADRTLKIAPESANAMNVIMSAGVLQARASADVAKARADQIDRERIRPNPGEPLPGLAKVLTWRRAFYLHESPSWRRARLLDHLNRVDQYVKRTPRRPATTSELSDIAAAEQANKSFVRATDAYAAVADLLEATQSVAIEEAWDAQLRQEEFTRWRGHVVASPANRLGVGLMHDAEGWGATLTTAFWREELGQWRPHGLGPLSKFVLFDVQTLIRVDDKGPHWLGNHGRMFEFARITVQPQGAWLRWLSRVGWGMALLTDLRSDLLRGTGRIDGYLLLLDGTQGPWLAGVRAGMVPSVQLGGDRLLRLQVAAEPFVQRRIGATGSLRGTIDFRREWSDYTAQAGLTLDVPWGVRQAWRTSVAVLEYCDIDWKCKIGWSVGLQW